MEKLIANLGASVTRVKKLITEISQWLAQAIQPEPGESRSNKFAIIAAAETLGPSFASSPGKQVERNIQSNLL